jgi:hypothetical protein
MADDAARHISQAKRFRRSLATGPTTSSDSPIDGWRSKRGPPPLEARRRCSGAFPPGSRIVQVGGSQNARPLDLTRDVHAPASVSGSLPHRGTSSTAGVRGTSVAAFQAQQPQSHGRFRRNPAAHAPSSDTCSAFVRSISVATPTSLLSAARRTPAARRDRDAATYPDVARTRAATRRARPRFSPKWGIHLGQVGRRQLQ